MKESLFIGFTLRKLPRMGPQSRCEACNEVTPGNLSLRRVGLLESAALSGR